MCFTLAELAVTHVQDALANFIQYIKDRKSVDLEDLAVEFGLKVKVRSALRSSSHIMFCRPLE